MSNQTETEEAIVLDTDDGAAKLMTITGWVSREGRFYGDDERIARYDGCTHKKCECGNLMTKNWLKCNSCRAKSDKEKYNAYPFEEWDGVKPICTLDGDQYFFNEEDIEFYLEDNELQPEDLQLVICSPNYAHSVESDYWEEYLPEFGEIPEALASKLKELNEFLATLPPLSWSPSHTRTAYKRDNDEK